MPNYKKHHFVPRFYLKNFSSDRRSINLYNINANKIVINANLKNQCYKDYFYGEGTEVEMMLGGIESNAASVINKIINEESLPKKLSIEHVNIASFLSIQYSRTTQSVDTINDGIDCFLKYVLRESRFDGEQLDLEKFTITIKDMAAKMVMESIINFPLLMDLNFKLLKSKDGCEFITSDNPVVFYNQLTEGVKPLNGYGVVSKGLQIFLPISPKFSLIFYDKDVYKIGGKRDFLIKIHSVKDMDSINKLQIVNAKNNVYFSSFEKSRIYNLRGDFKLRKDDMTSMQVFSNNLSDSQRSDLIVSSIRRNEIRLVLSFIKIFDKSKNFMEEFKKRERKSMHIERNQKYSEFFDNYRSYIEKNGYINFFQYIFLFGEKNKWVMDYLRKG